ncbi:platelet glycoprotein 4 isoform X2 [Polypterus senegalus]|uniref:platelet glycoprotein 4 isoform X2 n=1 Tax=Polypterus senegalus TaxID=55291 RepID=UPI0019640126|nr:platelet glycoprotein 4 isoform X2 [Polypterus senegalus]
MQIWLFNVQNPLEVILYGTSPTVAQNGPYTYKVRYLPKENITANPNNTISFLVPREAIFVPEMSIGNEEDKITTLNLVVAGAPALAPNGLLSMLNNIIKKQNSTLFQQRTVKEIVWGYSDPVLKALPGLIKDDMTGVMYPYNGTDDGLYDVFTGKDDIGKRGIIDKWKGQRSVSYWNDTYCNMINGTDGSSFPPFMDKKKLLYFFPSDICRSIYAQFEKEFKLKGIPVYRFKIPPETFASPNANPDNKCYCNEKKDDCALAGILDISSCKEGLPVYISLPHFLYGNKSLLNEVKGLNPNEVEHSIYLDVEPMTGFSLSFAKRLQINFKISPEKKIDALSKIKKPIIFPLLWLNETASLDDATAEELKASLNSKVQLLGIVELSFICIGVGIFFGCIVALLVMDRKQKKKKGEKIIIVFKMEIIY